MKEIVGKFFRDGAGVTALEYALVASVIALAILLSIHNIGTRLSTTFSSIAGSL
jgi:pilus assembly protein Flp/PilA